MHQFEDPWSTEEIERAKQLRQDGLSAAQVGRMLGRTRHAVIGKLWRAKHGSKKAERPKDFVPPFPSEDEIVWDDTNMATDAAQHLWVCVLKVAIDDACGHVVSDNNSPSNKKAESGRALEWLGSSDFVSVCNLAGMDPGAVYDAAMDRVMAESAERESRS